jgi:hypothetical protein
MPRFNHKPALSSPALGAKMRRALPCMLKRSAFVAVVKLCWCVRHSIYIPLGVFVCKTHQSEYFCVRTL